MTIIQADRIIVGDGSTVIERGAVALDGDRIVRVGTGAELAAAYPQAELREKRAAPFCPA